MSGAIAILDQAEAASLERLNLPKETTRSERYFHQPTNANAAALLRERWAADVVYERLSQHIGTFWKRQPGGHFARFDDVLVAATVLLEKAVDWEFERLKVKATGNELHALYRQAGISMKASQTKDRVLAALSYLADMMTVKRLPSLWNIAPECIPTTTGILDFSGADLILRAPKPGEYFRDPVNIDAQTVLDAGEPERFERLLSDIFPDPEVRRTACECFSLAFANKGSRIFPVCIGESGANGKNTLIDCLRIVLPERVGTISAATVTRGDQGARRFAAAELEGLFLAAVDEVSGAFDIAEVKRLTGGSTIAIERKGMPGYQIEQRWLLVALTNRLPTFQPATDAAFLQRLVLIPFESVFYFNDAQRSEYVRLGTDEGRLKEATNKDELLHRVQLERAAILKYLVETYIGVRDRGGRPYECEKCLRLKQAYQSKNDLAQEFFLEYFEREAGARVTYGRIIELWEAFTGEKKPSTRDVLKKFTDRFPWVERKTSHGVKYLVGLREATETPERPKSDQESTETVSETLFSGTRVSEEPRNNSDNGKTRNFLCQNNFSGFGYPSTPDEESSPIPGPEPAAAAPSENTAHVDFETPSIIYEELTRLYGNHRERVQAGGLDPALARVSIEELRLAAATRGILGDAFRYAFDSLQLMGLVTVDAPHVLMVAEGGAG